MSGITIRAGRYMYEPTGVDDKIYVDRELSQEQVDVLYQSLVRAGAVLHSVKSVTIYSEAPPHIEWVPGMAPWERAS